MPVRKNLDFAEKSIDVLAETFLGMVSEPGLHFLCIYFAGWVFLFVRLRLRYVGKHFEASVLLHVHCMGGS
jgi:hypothetical protein